MVSKERVMGGPSRNVLKHCRLDEKSHQLDWIIAQHNFQDTEEENVKGDHTKTFHVNWTVYSILKAVMCNTGGEGHTFTGKFESFGNTDMLKILWVYLLDGLSTSPQLTQKMQLQKNEPNLDKDLIAEAIDPGYQQLYLLFRQIFRVQDLLLSMSPNQDCPNVKVDEFLQWLCFVWKQAWNLEKNFSIDKQT